MAQIRVLSQHVADLIAAGEVVERPASVAKELVENAIDAGATFITVELRSGGIAYLRVTDDGIGISREDVPTAILRHSTSKIRNEDDLAHIGTLGFRGEALAAITAVSKLEILSCRAEDKIGTRLYQEGGNIIKVEDAGCQKGTTIIVRELFYNTPARMKFLKKDSSEGAAVESVITAIALSNPGISFQLIREGKVVLHTPGDGKAESCVYSVLGRDVSNSMLYAEGFKDNAAVSGFVSKPNAARGNRALQYFFVNGRYVKSKMLTVAVEQAYANLIMKGRFPSCVINISLPLEQCDVNVHPTKTEVKFAREREVFDAVYSAVKGALERDSSLTEATLFKPAVEYNKPQLETLEKPTAQIKKEPVSVSKPIQKMSFSVPTVSRVAEKEEMPQLQMNIPKQNVSRVVMETPKPEIQVSVKEEEPRYKFIGEILNTYLILESGEDAVLIDKHAAHERILFEKLKKERRSPQAQLLLSPIHITLSEEEIDVIEENRDVLASLGFEIDRSGHGEIAVRQVPDGVGERDVEATVLELSSTLKSKKRISEDEYIDELLHSIACKAAIKAGMVTPRLEAEKLANEVMSRGEIRYCPHGRPVAVTLSKAQLEKMFRRS